MAQWRALAQPRGPWVPSPVPRQQKRGLVVVGLRLPSQRNGEGDGGGPGPCCVVSLFQGSYCPFHPQDT